MAGVVGEIIDVPSTVTVNGQGVDVDGLMVWLCVGVSGCEPPAATAEPDSDGVVNLAWDTAGQAKGEHSLRLFAIIPALSESDAPNVLDTTEHKIVLASADGAVFVLMGTTDPHKGKVVGQVATPQPVIDTPAIPTHTPIPTNTITPTPTRTPTPTPRVDAEIVGIASSPNGQAMQGERVEIAVTVRNNGSRAMNIPVRLTFPSVDKKPERKSPRVQPGQTGVATFTWKTSNYEPGDYALTADLLLDGNKTLGDTVGNRWAAPDAAGDCRHDCGRYGVASVGGGGRGGYHRGVSAE